jgi:hypothetical protein
VKTEKNILRYTVYSKSGTFSQLFRSCFLFLFFFIQVAFSFLIHGPYFYPIPNQQQHLLNMLKTKLVFFPIKQAPCLTDTSEKRAEVESKRTLDQPDASPGMLPYLGGSEIVPDTMPQQLESPLGFDTSGQILIKHEKEPLVTLPVGLEIPPGYSRKDVEARKEKSISNQQLETPPGFGSLGRVLIKQEQDLVPLPVGLEVPPGFSRRVEGRKEKNIPNEFKGNPPSVNQVC